MSGNILDEIIENMDCDAVRILSDQHIKQLLLFADNVKEIGEKDAVLILKPSMDLCLLLPKQGDDEDVSDNTVAVSAFAYVLKRKPELLQPLYDFLEKGQE